MEVYRGDSYPIVVLANYQDGSSYTFQKGDILKLGIKKYVDAEQYEYIERKEIESTSKEIEFNISTENTKKLNRGDYIIEAELTYNKGQDVATLFQEKLTVKGDIINE